MAFHCLSVYPHMMRASKGSEEETDGPRVDPWSSDSTISEFLLRACHDLRTPLRAILAHAELLVRNSAAPRDGDFETQLNFIVEGARRIDLLAEGLTSYSIALRIEGSSFRPAPMDVLLRSALARIAKEVRENDAEVTHDGLPRVTGDPERLAQVFENLLLNAVRHRGAAAPRVHIAAEKQPSAWLFTVRDNGPGVEAAYLERIFKPFERLHAKGSAAPGLGLAVSREIIRKHGGQLWVESEVGSGSSFRFTIPAAD